MAVGPPSGRVGLSGRRAERAELDGLLDGARERRSGVLVVRGEAGIGKTALLEYAIASASDLRVLRAVGVESEMELAYASLHQLLVPMLDGLERLLRSQGDALAVAFGLGEGPAPDRFQVGLAVLSLLSEAAEERPLSCVIDDAQWLDRASARALAFVARRLLAEGVVMLFAAREPGEEFAGLPELAVEGLADADARELLQTAVPRPLDERVAGQLVEETRGNPLALLELPRGLSAARLAAGFGLLGAASLSGRIEESYRDQLEALPVDTRRMLVVAAAEPTGDPTVLWRAGERLGIIATALEPDAVVSAASVGASAGDNATTFARDRGAVRAIQAALHRPGQALVFTSGSAVFGVFNGGEATDVVYNEDSRLPLPASTFAPSSAGVHPMLVAGFGDAMAARVETERQVLGHSGLRGIVIRPGLVYGHGGSYDIPTLIGRARARGRAGHLGSGGTTQSFIHVDDLAELYCLAVERAPHGATLHGVVSNISQRELAQAVNRMLGAGDETDSLTLVQMLGMNTGERLGLTLTRHLSPRLSRKVGKLFTPPASVGSGISLSLDKRLSSDRTRRLLGWAPSRTDILHDIESGSYATR